MAHSDCLYSSFYCKNRESISLLKCSWVPAGGGWPNAATGQRRIHRAAGGAADRGSTRTQQRGTLHTSTPGRIAAGTSEAILPTGQAGAVTDVALDVSEFLGGLPIITVQVYALLWRGHRTEHVLASNPCQFPAHRKTSCPLVRMCWPKSYCLTNRLGNSASPVQALALEKLLLVTSTVASQNSPPPRPALDSLPPVNENPKPPPGR
jgi:hypothetical protein